MTFEEFWKQNRDRYLEISKVNVMLAINTAAEEAWENSAANTVGVQNFHRLAELDKMSNEADFSKLIDDHFDELV